MVSPVNNLEVTEQKVVTSCQESNSTSPTDFFGTKPVCEIPHYYMGHKEQSKQHLYILGFIVLFRTPQGVTRISANM